MATVTFVRCATPGCDARIDIDRNPSGLCSGCYRRSRPARRRDRPKTLEQMIRDGLRRDRT